LKNLPIFIKQWLVVLHDVLWIPVALFLAFWVRFNLIAVPDKYIQVIFLILPIALIVQIFCYWYFGLYRGIWRFASMPDIVRILKAVVVGVSFTMLGIFLAYRLENTPRSILILYPLFLLAGLSAPRLFYRWYKEKHLYFDDNNKKRALIVGAGRAGEMLARSMLRENKLVLVGFLDDDTHKIDRDIHGVRVVGGTQDMNKVLSDLAVDFVIVSIRNISATSMKSILRTCNDNNVECRILPSLTDTEINDENIDISLLRRIKIEDLLGRKSVKLDEEPLSNFIGGACVLITGAGGSIGSELCRQVMKYKPVKLVLFEQSEFNLYEINKELSLLDEYADVQVVSLLCDVRDYFSARDIFSEHRPNIVFHAAAYKHVPIIEDNVTEGVKTNLIGTINLTEVATQFNVEKFVMVSTDKAVNPTSTMGATKCVAEIYCQTLDEAANTNFITTRFGNVLDSTGSVVPLFREQIKNGGPVTVTHKDISRYFMSIPEAASLILQAATMGKGGEIFVLDMGEPIKIYDLARQMIRLSGYDPDKDLKIEITGLRPGEKLYEELFHETEDYSGTEHPKILLATSRVVDWDVFSIQLEKVQDACKRNDVDSLMRSLKEIIPEFNNNQGLSSDDIIVNVSPDVVH